MHEVTKTVIIQDHTQALCLQLKDDYEEQIEKLVEQAKTQAEQIIGAAEDQARQKAATMIETGIANTTRRYTQLRLAAAYAAKQEKEALRQAYLDKAEALVANDFAKLSPQTRNKLARRLYDDLRQAIKDAGYNEKDFTYEVYKGLKAPGAKAVHHDIKAVAKSGYLIFEDSLAARLQQQQDRIRQAADALID